MKLHVNRSLHHLNLKTLRKSYMSLIEVLISFALVVMCIFPLLYPHLLILREHRSFIDKIELDHQVNLLYGKILENLYKNEISWNTITSEQEIPINESLFDAKIPFQGSYKFKIEKLKSNEDKSSSAALASITFTFKHKSELTIDKKPKVINYKYNIFLLQKLNASPEIPENENEED